MNEAAAPVVQADIKLHEKSRLHETSFADGLRLIYPCEYLRVPAPDASAADVPVHGKQRVAIAPRATQA